MLLTLVNCSASCLFGWSDFTQPIMMCGPVDPGYLHAVTMVGYEYDSAWQDYYFIFKNSWGSTVEDKGFFKLGATYTYMFRWDDTQEFCYVNHAKI